MLSRPRKVKRSVGVWTLGLCLIALLGVPVEAQDLPAFANKLLQWPKPELDDEGEPESEEEGREAFIETDRNSFTFAPLTPGDGRLIVESAYTYIRIGKEGAKHSFPETVFRYGIGDRLELRFGYNFETGPASRAAEGDIAGNFGINAEQQIFYGFKYAVTREGAGSAFMPHQRVPRSTPHADRLRRDRNAGPARLRLGLDSAQWLDLRPGTPVRNRPRGK